MLCITDLYGLKLILIYMVNGQVSGKIWDKIQSVFYPYNRTEQISLKCQFSRNLSYAGKSVHLFIIMKQQVYFSVNKPHFFFIFPKSSRPAWYLTFLFSYQGILI